MVDGHGCQKMMNVGDRKGERYIMWCKVRGTYGSVLDVIGTYYSLLTINVYIYIYWYIPLRTVLLCYILLRTIYRVIRDIYLRKYSYVKVCDVQTFWILRVMKDKE